MLLPEDTAVEKLHHVKGAADDAVVVAQGVDARHRHRGRFERAQDTELAVDRVGARQERPGRLAPQHVKAGAGLQLVGRVRLPAGEAVGGDKRGKQAAALLIHTTEDYCALDIRIDARFWNPWQVEER